MGVAGDPAGVLCAVCVRSRVVSEPRVSERSHRMRVLMGVLWQGSRQVCGHWAMLGRGHRVRVQQRVRDGPLAREPLDRLRVLAQGPGPPALQVRHAVLRYFVSASACVVHAAVPAGVCGIAGVAAACLLREPRVHLPMQPYDWPKTPRYPIVVTSLRVYPIL